MKLALRLAAAIAVFAFCVSPTLSQPLARFVAPTNTSETAVQPTFRIVTKYRIDSSSVHWNLEWFDTNYFVLPILCVVPYEC